MSTLVFGQDQEDEKIDNSKPLPIYTKELIQLLSFLMEGPTALDSFIFNGVPRSNILY